MTGVNATFMAWPVRICALGWLMVAMGGMAAVQCMMAAWVCGLACGLITNARGPPPVAEMTGVSAAECAPSGELTTMLAGAWDTMKKICPRWSVQCQHIFHDRMLYLELPTGMTEGEAVEAHGVTEGVAMSA